MKAAVFFLLLALSGGFTLMAGSMKQRPESVSGASRLPEEPVLVLMDKELGGNRCWVRFYEERNFQGNSITIAGPREMPAMEFPANLRWQGKIASLELGPGASLVLFGNPGYEDPDFLFEGALREPDLLSEPNWEKVESLKLQCQGS